jgi:RNA polymerase sigma-70 factor (ECF subfamily)
VSITTGNSESQTIERCRIGDREAFRLLYDAHKDHVYSLALYTLNGDVATAEDVAQEVFVRVFQKIGQFRCEADIKTWLYRMTANACIDEFRRRKRCTNMSEVEARAAVCSEFSKVELASAVCEALAELSAEQRAAVLLKYYEELSYDEMSVILDCSKGTIASRLNRGLRILANKLSFLRQDDLERKTP